VQGTGLLRVISGRRSNKEYGDVLPSSARVNGLRLWHSIELSSSIGRKGSGLGRLALSDDDKQMRDLFVEWCVQAGLTIEVDAVGNTFARRDGVDNELPAVMFGSHLDSQQEGGRFDGVLGVLGALEVVRTLNDLDYRTRRPLQIVNWTNEEGARFPPPMLGSGCFAGAYDLDWAYAIESTDDGRSVRQELNRIGYLGSASLNRELIDSYFELHIEQGPRLEKLHTQIGVVSDAATVPGFKIEYIGETAHAGTRPMTLRKNALVAAARLAAAIDDIGIQHGADGGMATTARIAAVPNKPGILSNYCEIVGDVRHPDPATADSMISEVELAARAAAETTHTTFTFADRWDWGGAIFDDEAIETVRVSVHGLGYSFTDISSQAGHDAYFMARLCPTAMIFVPCVDGITHHPAERIAIDDSSAGANVLLHSVVARADRYVSGATEEATRGKGIH
jgi:N-carbamoyl-L-amino-acid hydrolase